MTRFCLATAAAVVGMLSFSASMSSAQVIFSDEFSNPDGTVLPGKLPTVGLAWTQPTGTAMTVQGGAISTVGGDRGAFANFSQAFAGSQRLLKLTVDFSLLTHNNGYAGVSLFNGTQEIIFLGDLSGTNPSLGFSINFGPPVYATPVTASGPVTLLYDRTTGRTTLYKGESIGGQVLGSAISTSGLSFDRLRVQNGGGADIGVSKIAVEMLAQGPVTVDAFLGIPQISIQSDGTILAWQTSFANQVTISPGLGTVADAGSSQISPPLGDTFYNLVATDSVSGNSSSAQTTLRTVTGGTANYRYIRYRTIKTRGNALPTQLSELDFFMDGLEVVPVSVQNPGGGFPSAAEDFNKVIDGLTDTKWLDYLGAPLIFDFGQPTALNSYGFVTANDAIERDPVRWLFEGSNDGVTWSLVDNVTSFDYDFPTARRGSSAAIPVPGTSVMPFTQLEVSAVQLVSGDTLYLNYEATGAQAVVLNDGVNNTTLAAGAGTLAVNPTSGATYTLTATSATGLVSTSTRVVQVIAPTITQIAYQNFESSGDELSLLGGAKIVNDFATRPLPGDFKRLRLNEEGVTGQATTAWFRKRQKVGAGFETNFGLHITRLNGGSGADGVAFVIQNNARGSNLSVSNAEQGTTTSALSIGFDTYANTGEASNAQLRVASAGQVLALVDLATFPGLTLRTPTLLVDSTAQGAPYAVRVVYAAGSLNIYIDGVQVVTNLAVDLATLGAVDQAGTAYVGFAGRTGNFTESHDITSWTLTTGGKSAIRLISSSINTTAGQVTLTWESSVGKNYRITTSGDLINWSTVLVPTIAGAAGQTTHTANFTGGSKGFFRVEEK